MLTVAANVCWFNWKQNWFAKEVFLLESGGENPSLVMVSDPCTVSVALVTATGLWNNPNHCPQFRIWQIFKVGDGCWNTVTVATSKNIYFYLFNFVLKYCFNKINGKNKDQEFFHSCFLFHVDDVAKNFHRP